MCHVLLAVPAVSLLLFGVLPWREAAGLYFLVNGPILVLAWSVWRVHRRPAVTGREGLIGRKAVAETALRPEGMVRCRGELWRACASAPVEAGAALRVVGVTDLTLAVEPVVRKEAAGHSPHLSKFS
ncbi:MAG: hypothetical protein HYR52_06915 [Candidatus Tectomicrobia bacterium]|nr:hypothetical protein [Candidatus Tectomicrobia bacterium]